MRETKTAKMQRILEIITRLKKEYPEIKGALEYVNPLQCVVATILSAQCTDARVNKVTPALFAKYPDILAFAEADQAELENDIRSTGFFRNKATSIRKCSQEILNGHKGQVPDTIDELVKLSGIGRKTANCVIGNAYGKPAIMVDTHVKRLSNRMGMTTQQNPDKIEFELKALLPESEWMPGSHALIMHGRAVCKSRKPMCENCSIQDICPRIIKVKK